MDHTDNIYDDPQRLFQAMTGGNPNIPTPDFLSLSQVERKAKQHSYHIFAAQRALVNLLDRYESTLIKRWLKRTTVQRQKLLTTAFPGIPPTHRPDFWAIRKETTPQRRVGTQFYDHWLLPSVNREDLEKPKNLLLFLRSRTRNLPGNSVNADANSIHVGHTAQAIMPPYLSGYTMLLAGQRTQQTYGRMLSWDENDQAFDMMSSGIGLQPGEGLQVLEIQQRKMQFLQTSAELILQGLPLSDLSIPKQPEPPQDYLQPSNAEWPSLAKEVEEAPYRMQSAFDVTRLQTFVTARRDEAEDHIWSLREDPSYFHEVALECSEHRQEQILTATGKTHPVIGQDVFWERVLSNLVLDAYGGFLAWDIVCQELGSIARLRSTLPYQETISQELPDSLTEALAHFEHLVDEFSKGPLSMWKVAMMSSPPLRQYFVREPQDPTNTRIRVTMKDAQRKKNDHLLWLLEVFLQEDQLFLCRLDNVCDELEREIRANKASRERISPYIASLISDLSLSGEIKRQIGLLNPGPRMTVVVGEEEKQDNFIQKTQLLSQISSGLTGIGKGLANVATPLTKFYYPTHKKRTKATTETMRQAETNLDNFWSHVDGKCNKNTASKTIHQMLEGKLSQRKLQRTPEWVEPTNRAEGSIDQTDSEAISSQIAALELERRTEHTVSAAIAHTREKPKTKTWGTPGNSSSAAP
ncbi:MAG: hypothetical protein Q9169_004959 [Polycauliona sp. 2 TL-2023]